MSNQGVEFAGEHLRTHAEILPLSEQEQALLSVLTPPDETLVDWCQEFDRLAQNAVASQLTPREQQAAAAVVDMLGWEFFGKPGEELPSSLALFYDDEPDFYEEKVGVIYRPDLGLNKAAYGYQFIDSVKWHFQPIFKRQHAFLAENKDNIIATFAEVVRSRPAYARLKAFAEPAPQPAEQPLTPQWRLIKEQQAEQEIKRRHGLTPEEYIPTNSAASRELARAVYNLDLQTRPQEKPDQPDGLARARQWFIGEAQGWLDDEAIARGDKIAGFRFRPETDDEDEALLPVSASGQILKFKKDIESHMWDLAAKLLQLDAPPKSLGLLLVYEDTIYEDFVWALFDDQHASNSFAEILEAVLLKRAESAYENVFYRGDFSYEKLITYLRRPKGPIFTYFYTTEGTFLPDNQPRNQEITVSPLEVIEWKSRQRIGYAEYRNDSNEANRLIMGQPQTHLPRFAPYDLAINFFPSQYRANKQIIPFIPGYETVAFDGTRYCFKRLDSDPYQGAGKVEIVKSDAVALASVYEQMGLVDLAKAVTYRSVLTAADLAELISQHSDYTFDVLLNEEKAGSLSGPSAFESLVKSGRLQLQCSGAAAFLAESLKIALPGCVAGVVGGYVLPAAKNYINGVQHAQTLLAHQGIQYILDSTPPAPLGINVEMGMLAPIRDAQVAMNQAPRDAAAPLLATPPLDTLGMEDRVNLEDIIKEQEPEAHAKRLERIEQILMTVFDVKSKLDMYEKVVALKRDDPIRQVLETLIQLNESQSAEHDLKDCVEYLGNYIKTEETTIKRAGLSNHSKDLIQSILNCLR